MSVEFHATAAFSSDLCSQVSSLEPLNPFRTFAYAEAMKALGAKPILLYSSDQARVVNGCFGLVRCGRINKSMEIPSIVPATADQSFWTGLLNFCQQERLSQLEVHSFGSESSAIPALPGESNRQKRVEYVLELRNHDVRSTMSTNHRRNLQKAEKAGILIERTTALEACHDHVRLQEASMERRIALGEQVSSDAQISVPSAFLTQHAGELFRAILEKRVLSSILVLRSPRAAYYHSAGTSPEGMNLGASHFLIWKVSQILCSEGVERFNLGGADSSNSGLERFKKGFNPQEILLESASFYFASPLRRRLASAARAVREDPYGLIRDLVGRVEDYYVYCCTPGNIAEPILPPQVTFRKITDRELLEVAHQHAEMKIHKEKYEKSRMNDAYGVFVDGVLAQVSWLVTADHDRLSKERNVKLKAGEAEITHAVTLVKYRNRGLYALGIQCLVIACRNEGVRCVYMITSSDNIASQKGIEKAGLHRAGRIWRIRYRHLGATSFAIRGHRLAWLLAPFRFFSSLRPR